MTRQLKIDLEELAMVFEASGGDVEAYLHRKTGEILFDEMLDDEPDLDEYLIIPHQPSYEGYNDMEAFIEEVTDTNLQEKLKIAIDGKGGFRRFKDVLVGYPDEREQWFAFSAARVEERIREWLASEDIEAI